MVREQVMAGLQGTCTRVRSLTICTLAAENPVFPQRANIRGVYALVYEAESTGWRTPIQEVSDSNGRSIEVFEVGLEHDSVLTLLFSKSRWIAGERLILRFIFI